tara:strand:+ start:790 stop:1056 length:267 start_codon:yes stop_codon:yes gene_type:complete
MITKTQEDFLEVLKGSLGVVSVALQKTGTPYSEYKLWLENVFFKGHVKDVEETSIDYVENQLMKQIQEGNTSAITFYLKTKGKNRGYN